MVVESWGIRFINPDGSAGLWLEHYDPDGGDIAYPTGVIIGTGDRSKALRFSTVGEAMAFVLRASTRTPFRPDGKANRPLTAFTVTIQPLRPMNGEKI